MHWNVCILALLMYTSHEDYTRKPSLWLKKRKKRYTSAITDMLLDLS